MQIPATQLVVGDRVIVAAGEVIPGDGDVVEGAASVDESAITGESAPVIREAGGDRTAVTGGTRVLSDEIIVVITAAPGETFLDRMIALVEGASRRKTPNEIALSILLSSLTLIFLFAVATVAPMAAYAGSPQSPIVLVALLVCLIPTTIGALLSAIGIAGHGPAGPGQCARHVRPRGRGGRGRGHAAAGQDRHHHPGQPAGHRFPAPAGRRVRRAPRRRPATPVWPTRHPRAARWSSSRYGSGRRTARCPGGPSSSRSGPDPDVRSRSAQSADPQGSRIGGAPVAGARRRRSSDPWSTRSPRGAEPRWWWPSGSSSATRVARRRPPPRVLGVIALRDVVKPGMTERFAQLRAMGIRTVMITGDNPLTAAAIAAEAGVDDFLAEATPEDKMALIRREQADGRMVAMTGDGTNDAPALAAADVGVAMNTGTSAAKEAGNMVDLDSDPTKLIDVVAIGKQLLITRGALTTFSIANDVAKYFAIIPAMFVSAYPGLAALNVMRLESAQTAILSAVIFNALIIVALIPLALRGVRYRAVAAADLLRRNLLDLRPRRHRRAVRRHQDHRPARLGGAVMIAFLRQLGTGDPHAASAHRDARSRLPAAAAGRRAAGHPRAGRWIAAAVATVRSSARP